jgi:hypothetical protein
VDLISFLFREFLQQRIINEFKIPCYSPANGCTLVINPASNTQSIANMIPVEASNYLIEQQFEHDDFDDDEDGDYDGPRGIGDFEDLFKSGTSGLNSSEKKVLCRHKIC